MSPLLTAPLPIEHDGDSDAAARSSVRTTYPGGKGGAGVYQTIINQIPPHQFYLEPFLGSGTIMFHKRPARYDIGADINDATISDALNRFAGRASCQFLCTGALALLESLAAQLTTASHDGGIGYRPPALNPSAISTDARFGLPRERLNLTPMATGTNSGDGGRPEPEMASGTGDRRQNQRHDRAAILDRGILPSHLTARDVVIYADPPYLKATRRSQNRLYQFEPGTDAISDDAWHTRLLNVLNSLPCYVLLSGYRNELYEKLLAQSKWRTVDYKAVTRSGRVAVETLWCNFSDPVELHDYRYLGRDKRERQRIKRKVQRWQAKMSKMTTLERQAILAALTLIP